MAMITVGRERLAQRHRLFRQSGLLLGLDASATPAARRYLYETWRPVDGLEVGRSGAGENAAKLMRKFVWKIATVYANIDCARGPQRKNAPFSPNLVF
jgi:hypothetical protein